METVISSILDTKPKLRETKQKHAQTVVAVCVLMFILGLPMVTKGGNFSFLNATLGDGKTSTKKYIYDGSYLQSLYFSVFSLQHLFLAFKALRQDSKG